MNYDDVIKLNLIWCGLTVNVTIDNRGGGGIGNAIRMNGECVSRSRDHEMFAIFFVKDGYIPVWFDLR